MACFPRRYPAATCESHRQTGDAVAQRRRHRTNAGLDPITTFFMSRSHPPTIPISRPLLFPGFRRVCALSTQVARVRMDRAHASLETGITGAAATRIACRR